MINLPTDFMEALQANGPSATIPGEDNIFEFLIGAWDFDWYYNQGTQMARNLKGEWLFSWIIDGYAIQDVFICPKRESKEFIETKDVIYGTKLRVYNKKKKLWDIYYVCNGYSTILEARKIGASIVLDSVSASKYKMKWIYSNIKENSFQWKSAISKDDGHTWIVQGEFFATKRK